jgi:hypothetical protein
MISSDSSLESKAREVIKTAFPRDEEYQRFMFEFMLAWQGEYGLMAICSMPLDDFRDVMPYIAGRIMEGSKSVDNPDAKRRIDALRERYQNPLHMMKGFGEVAS